MSGTRGQLLREALAATGSPPTPKPDFAYGYTTSILDTSDNYRRIVERHPQVARLSSDILYPFFVVEWKAARSGGTMCDAETQAARSGVALVWARGQLHHLATGTYGEAVTSVCVSLTIDSNCALLWVNWYDDRTQHYRMDKVADYMLGRDREVKELIATISNIVEWGLEDRLRDLRNDMDKVAEGIQKPEVSELN
ncbi:hypothetical protein GP486_005204 [Trichoglossum hirsutum]|uniref:DUF7924 domain-containing protein n=1 Tax=Trichoglossum hirsutum TaxID=265104 RepID=A0A9P8L9X6_9PEZI|nr:hypothetical protein GP486_005204 [Trichoglossum hirsutum]